MGWRTGVRKITDGVYNNILLAAGKSIEVIKSALEIDPKHQIANFNLGIVNFAKNDVEKAKRWWKNAVDINPSSNIGKKAEDLLKSNN